MTTSASERPVAAAERLAVLLDDYAQGAPMTLAQLGQIAEACRTVAFAVRLEAATRERATAVLHA